MVHLANLLSYILTLSSLTLAFPSYRSLEGMPREEFGPTFAARTLKPPPGPLDDTSTKLVNDKAHPWKPLRPGDIRGPCPGLNTLASHGYLPRSGIASPAQIVEAVQEGFNMENAAAIIATYGAHLVDGNPITDLLSIGRKTPRTGPDPPPPAIVGGLNTHGVFEGDASMTRADFFFGDNHSFNETLFDEFVEYSNRFGGGKYNLTVAGEFRWRRIQDSIATNPTFSFVAPRYFAAYGESVFPINFFVDGRRSDGQLSMDVARSFFRDMRMPDDFHRPNKPMGAENIEAVVAAHPIPPGANVGGVNSYVPDPTSANLTNFCLFYENFVNQTVRGLYPNPTGSLRKALNTNLQFFYKPIGEFGCRQVFPYGKD